MEGCWKQQELSTCRASAVCSVYCTRPSARGRGTSSLQFYPASVHGLHGHGGFKLSACSFSPGRIPFRKRLDCRANSSLDCGCERGWWRIASAGLRPQSNGTECRRVADGAPTWQRGQVRQQRPAVATGVQWPDPLAAEAAVSRRRALHRCFVLAGSPRPWQESILPRAASCAAASP